MLEWFIGQQQAVYVTLAAERGFWHLMPKNTDIAVMEQLCQLLDPLSKITDAISTERRKGAMQMACFTDSRFKTNFLDDPVDDVVDSCVQEVLKLTPVQVWKEPQSTKEGSGDCAVVVLCLT